MQWTSLSSIPASLPRREAQLTLRLFPCFWVVNTGGCRVESGNTGEKLWASNTAAAASSQQTPRPSLSLCYYPILQEPGNCSFTMANHLPTVAEMPSASLHSPVGLFHFCCFLALLAYFVCAVSLLLGRELFLWLCMGRASSLWDNLPCFIWVHLS